MNILHLSDIHFGRNNPAYGLKDSFTKHDQILDELIEIISDFGDELRPEHIVFTGDIAWMGKPEEFREAIRWFKRLLHACNLTGKDLSFCVGNHDLDLSCTSGKTALANYQIQEMDELYRYKNIHILEPYLSAYNDFCHELGVEPYAYPCEGKKYYSYSVGYKDVTFSNKKTIRLVAMNTALMMTQSKIPADQMWLGREQLRSLAHYKILPADSSIWYTIALFHHPDRFLHPNETNTYDGRTATLPLLLNMADLLLCGHSESCGCPRISRQPGGGSLLFGGAAYYSDDHINSFSMIYISDTKQTMAYIPYVYENGWTDYDFYRTQLFIPKQESLPDDGTIYEQVSLLCHSKERTLSIPCAAIACHTCSENGKIHSRLDNSKDLMNCCVLSCDWTTDTPEVPLQLSLNPGQKHRVSCLHEYLKYYTFFEQNPVEFCEIRSADEQLIFAFPGCQIEKPTEFFKHNYDAELLNTLVKLEDFFNIRFALPDIPSTEDLQNILLLKNLIEDGSSQLAPPCPSFSFRVNQEKLQQILSAAKNNNVFCLKNTTPHTISLLGVHIQLKDAVLLSHPYRLDIEDAIYKAETFREGDERYCNFFAFPESTTYLVKSATAIPSEISSLNCIELSQIQQN